MGYGGELDPVTFAESALQAQAQKPEKFPCPYPQWREIRADQCVAEFAHCSLMEAQQLPPLTYSELLFCATAMTEAQPLADAFAEAKAKRKPRAEAQAKKPRSLAGTRLT